MNMTHEETTRLMNQYLTERNQARTTASKLIQDIDELNRRINLLVDLCDSPSGKMVVTKEFTNLQIIG